MRLEGPFGRWSGCVQGLAREMSDTEASGVGVRSAVRNRPRRGLMQERPGGWVSWPGRDVMRSWDSK
ncbi:hypothetical protein NDU88_010240 [Pleurodeles waltl]|uniref:Uncharacterized protein n=1 Tax=Pleurodeles waltl TaxID=8319 RepID=A0AAV7PV43_PLEWA|nr:hypothetical protein NDU88_010240 [Pleurodeles waltl]